MVYTPLFCSNLSILCIYIHFTFFFSELLNTDRYPEGCDALKNVGEGQTFHLAPRWMRPKLFCTTKNGGSFTLWEWGWLAVPRTVDCDGHSVMPLFIWSKHSFFTFHGMTPYYTWAWTDPSVLILAISSSKKKISFLGKSFVKLLNHS